jgi:integrase/recombinase XerD
LSAQRNGRAFSNVSPSMLFKKIFELAGIGTSSHSGRRTFATRLNAKGVGMRTIQKLMGHRHIGTTALYCEVCRRSYEKSGRISLKSTDLVPFSSLSPSSA